MRGNGNSMSNGNSFIPRPGQEPWFIRMMAPIQPRATGDT